ncbi:MAG: hypothetical protein NC078_05020 [Ruminococcus sp.]|nr:hypothetical protein [Ruminococcus sp.]
MWTYNETLYHHGIKGQKWGVRRYQNPDGSLTAAGKQRYLSQNTLSLQKKAQKYEHTNAAKAAKFAQRAERSAELDDNFFGANKMSSGKRLVADFMTGFGKTSYDVIRSTGVSKGKSLALTLLGGPISALAVRNNYIKQDERHSGRSSTVNNSQPHVSSGNSSVRQTSTAAKRPANTSQAPKLSKREQEKRYVNVNNAVAKRMNGGLLDSFNKKWEGKYNTQAYMDAYYELSNEIFNEEYKKMYG